MRACVVVVGVVGVAVPCWVVVAGELESTAVEVMQLNAAASAVASFLQLLSSSVGDVKCSIAAVADATAQLCG